jgi:hypothetical protein
MQILGWEQVIDLQMWRSSHWDQNNEPDLLFKAIWAACDLETRLPQYIRFAAEGGVEEGWDVRNLWLTKESLCGGRFGGPGDSGAPVLATVDSRGESEESRLMLVGMVVGGIVRDGGNLGEFGEYYMVIVNE